MVHALRFANRVLIVALGIVALMPPLLWFVVGDMQPTINPMSLNHLLADADFFPVDVWLWAAVVFLCSTLAMLLAVRSLASPERNQLAWACIGIALGVSVYVFVRGYVIGPTWEGWRVAWALDSLGLCLGFSGCWLLARLFSTFPGIPTVDWYKHFGTRWEHALTKVVKRALEIAWGPASLLAGCAVLMVAPYEYYDAYLVPLLTGQTSALPSRFFAATIGAFSFCMAMIGCAFIIQYSGGDAASRRRLRWLLVGVVFSGVVCSAATLLLLADFQGAQAGTCEPAQPFILLCSPFLASIAPASAIGATAVLILVASICMTILSNGLIEPTLALGKGAVVSLMVLLFFVVSVLLEELFESELLARLALPDEVASLISAALVASLYRQLDRYVDQPLAQHFSKRFASTPHPES